MLTDEHNGYSYQNRTLSTTMIINHDTIETIIPVIFKYSADIDSLSESESLS